MDNASKALLYAGGFLIGVLIISLGMYFYTSFQSAYSENMDILNSHQKDNFNSFLVKYGNNNAIIRGSDVWNILSYVEDARNNEYSIGREITLSSAFFSLDPAASNYYRKRLYFTDTCNNVFKYSYTYGVNGLVSNVTITN